LIAVAAIPLSLLALSLFGFFPRSALNCWQDDIDIASGRIRQTRYLLCVPVKRRVWDSSLMNAVLAEDVAGRRAEWHPVVTLSPGLHHSPHYRFHGAINQIRELEICWDFRKMTPAARRKTARNVLRSWQQSGNYFQAGDYIQGVWERSLAAEKSGKSIDVSDVPDL
jgi:hypothetical protein